MTKDYSLPCPAIDLMPHRPPMLLINRLLARDREKDTGIAEGVIPEAGFFYDPENGFLPEYFIELVAQSAAAINGYDALVDGKPQMKGFLVGVDDFVMEGSAQPGETVQIHLIKKLEFGAVTIMEGRVAGARGEICHGNVRAWEEGK
ncbi:MAG: ACP dehydratase [Proteobacteria bacterium]|nr:ACP dehydratase [Pseudomonadota bacterium]MBU1710674.1 ACP dehydratase [Pseudomonadota bacterium]